MVLSVERCNLHKKQIKIKFKKKFANSKDNVVMYTVSIVSLCRDPYADPYYDYEMEALWRGGQYENFRVQYTEAPLPYHYSVSIPHSLVKIFFCNFNHKTKMLRRQSRRIPAHTVLYLILILHTLTGSRNNSWSTKCVLNLQLIKIVPSKFTLLFFFYKENYRFLNIE